MPLLEPGLDHYLWTEALLRLRRGSQVVGATRALGQARYYTTAKAILLELGRCYASLLHRAAAAGYAIAAAPEALAREHLILRPLLGAAPAVIASARDGVVDGLIEYPALEKVLEVCRRGQGLVTLSTHLGATGCLSALLSRRGIPRLIIRDSQFRRYEGTRHGRHYYLGAETLFPDHADPASADRVMLRCARVLRAGGVVSYLADAGHGRSTVPGQVFGQVAPWRMGLVQLAARTGAAVAPVFLPYAAGKIQLLLEQIYEPRSEADLDAFVHDFSNMYERVVAQYPASLSWNNYERRVLAGHAA